MRRNKRPPNPSREKVVQATLNILAREGVPLRKQQLFDALVNEGVVIHGKDPTLVLSTMLWRSQDKVVKLREHGYWIAAKPYRAAGYRP